MTSTVELPIWLLVLILLFAAVTFASHFLFPSVRWFLRRRAERVVAELNKRLERPIQPFKLARRTDMIQRVIYDPAVIKAVQAHAAATGVREDVAFEEAKRYAREIVPSFSATAYFGFATRAARRLSKFLFDVHFSEARPGALVDIPADASVVYVMNHRSNMDYVLVTYLAAQRSALSYAVGEWARVWPLQSLIRSMGAFFIRRKSRNDLYRRVLARYVQLSIGAGVTQAIFPEGGLSLTGALGQPKLGLLSYIVDGADPAERDIVFVPVAINYDRVLEDRVLIAANRHERRRFRASAPEAALFTLRYFLRRIRGRGHRFGSAVVVAAEPLSLRSLKSEQKATPAALGRALFNRIGRAIPATASSLIARAIVEADAALGEDEAIARAIGHAERLRSEGVVVAQEAEALENALRFEIEIMRRRNILAADDPLRPVKDGSDLLAFYAASLDPHFAADAQSDSGEKPLAASIPT